MELEASDMGEMMDAPDRDPFAFLNCRPDYGTADLPGGALGPKNITPMR
ncbi:hypothetical protein QRO11_13090 [Paracidovorax citrulli]|uniref:Uncharacterized protein n=1 Tax=Paracidovorax citrulli TaxID=80869 RepID=A0ABY9AJA5_PARCI|nr:hypothetical protein [Paracidovorax citrulli]MVT28307.1 hypothetical protein [Paracidovorax citrulli]UEG44431.1 hypothetical protein LKW27_12165 [Paracidovorax citrulli]WIY31942.1 hypothetical protein QRO09_09570 [Paracidovorax citrulli]WIY32908.1 hypothetical protein QRO11_13090 [Paracidovorax citrulli]WIY41217.1 hypothetical protein QRO10_09835 [Paracidovorax citrulli]